MKFNTYTSFMFQNEQVSLEKKGDYVIWGVGIPHKWAVEEDSLVIIVSLNYSFIL